MHAGEQREHKGIPVIRKMAEFLEKVQTQNREYRKQSRYTLQMTVSLREQNTGYTVVTY